MQDIEVPSFTSDTGMLSDDGGIHEDRAREESESKAQHQQQQPMSPAKAREERKKVLKLSVRKLRAIEDPETSLCRSVLINNTMKRIQAEMRSEKAAAAAATTRQFTPAANLEDVFSPAVPVPVQPLDAASESGSSSASSDTSSSCSSSDDEEEAATAAAVPEAAPATTTAAESTSSDDEDEIMSASDMKRRAKKRAAEKAATAAAAVGCSSSATTSKSSYEEPPEKRMTMMDSVAEDLLSEVYMPPSISTPYGDTVPDADHPQVPLPLRLEPSSWQSGSWQTTDNSSDSWSTSAGSVAGGNRSWSSATATTTSSDCWMTSRTSAWSSSVAAAGPVNTSSSFDWCSDESACDPWGTAQPTTVTTTTSSNTTITTTASPNSTATSEEMVAAGSPESLTNSSDSSSADFLTASAEQAATGVTPAVGGDSCNDGDQHLSCRHQSQYNGTGSVCSPGSDLQTGVFNRMLSSLVTSLES